MIEQTIQNYFKGYQIAEAELIKKSFHEDVKLLSTTEGRLEITTLRDWLENLENRKLAGDIRIGELKIESIDQTVDTASVKLKIIFPHAEFTDYLSLLKLEGNWVIVGKIYHVDIPK